MLTLSVAIPCNSAASQEVSTVHPNSIPSQEGSTHSTNSQGSIPQDSAASQEASMVHPNSTPLWEYSANRAISQGGNPSDNVASQEASAVQPNSTLPWEDSSNSTNSDGGNPPLPVQSTILGLRQLGAHPSLGLPRQASLFPRQIVRSPKQASSPFNSATSQVTSSAGSQEAVALPLLAIILPR